MDLELDRGELPLFTRLPRSPDHHALAAAVGYLHLDVGGTGVRGVLGELLNHGGEAVYDLTGGYLLGYEGIEHRYLTQEIDLRTLLLPGCFC